MCKNGYTRRNKDNCNDSRKNFGPCVQYECLTDQECPDDKRCNEKNECENPCLKFGSIYCANDNLCVVEEHRATCKCPRHQHGNPWQNGQCEYYYCEKDQDCLDKVAFTTCVNLTCEGN